MQAVPGPIHIFRQYQVPVSFLPHTWTPFPQMSAVSPIPAVHHRFCHTAAHPDPAAEVLPQDQIPPVYNSWS